MSSADDPGALGAAAFEPHDHGRCVAEAMSAAERICDQRGVKLTPIRRRVLELLWENHRPIGAYALLERLREERSAQAPTVYRALDFLVAQGLAHKVMRLNAFTACCRPEEPHAPQFLICSECDGILEIVDPHVETAVGSAAKAVGFATQEAALELVGRCPACQARGETR